MELLKTVPKTIYIKDCERKADCYKAYEGNIALMNDQGTELIHRYEGREWHFQIQDDKLLVKAELSYCTFGNKIIVNEAVNLKNLEFNVNEGWFEFRVNYKLDSGSRSCFQCGRSSIDSNIDFLRRKEITIRFKYDDIRSHLSYLELIELTKK